MHVSERGDRNLGAAIHICGFLFLHHVASNYSFLIFWFQNLQNECAHTQTTAQKLSSFLKSWSTLPSSEVREYNKSIKSTMGQLSSTQKSLQDKTSALEGLGQLFDQYNNVNADMKRYLILTDFLRIKQLSFILHCVWFIFEVQALRCKEYECWFADFV